MADMKEALQPDTEENGSEYGRGFLYPLALFPCHVMNLGSTIETYERIGLSKNRAVAIWINGAADHLFEFMPEHAPAPLRELCQQLKDDGMKWRNVLMGDKMTVEDAEKLIESAKEIFRKVDLHYGVPAVKANWE